MEKSLEERIVDAIIEDLNDLADSGLLVRYVPRQEWDLVDEDVRSEIKERWMNIVVEEIDVSRKRENEG